VASTKPPAAALRATVRATRAYFGQPGRMRARLRPQRLWPATAMMTRLRTREGKAKKPSVRRMNRPSSRGETVQARPTARPIKATPRLTARASPRVGRMP